MTHTTRDLLVAYTDGELSPAQRAEVEALLASDPDVAREREALDQAKDALHAYLDLADAPSPAAPAASPAASRASAQPRPAPVRVEPGQPGVGWSALAGAAALALLALALVGALSLALSRQGDMDDSASGETRSSSPAPLPRGEALPRVQLTPPQRTETIYYPLATCLVSGKPLAANSWDLVVDGRLARVYSPAEAARFAADKDRYFARLDQAYRDQQRPGYPLRECLVSGEPLGENAHEFLLDPRWPLSQRLYRAQKETKQPYRYTVFWRLIRVKDAAAEAAFKADPARAHRLLLRLIAAHAAASRRLLRQRNKAYACAVNLKLLGREGEDPVTGGYRAYVCHQRTYWVCCRSCQFDICELESPRDLAVYGYLAHAILLDRGLPLPEVQRYPIGTLTQQHLLDSARAPAPGVKVELIGRLRPVTIEGRHGGTLAVRGRGAIWVEAADGRRLGSLLRAIQSRQRPYLRVDGVARQLAEHPLALALPAEARRQLFTVTIDPATLRGVAPRTYQRTLQHLRQVK